MGKGIWALLAASSTSLLIRESSLLDMHPKISSAAPRNENPAWVLISPYLFSFITSLLSRAAPVLFAAQVGHLLKIHVDRVILAVP